MGGAGGKVLTPKVLSDPPPALQPNRSLILLPLMAQRFPPLPGKTDRGTRHQTLQQQRKQWDGEDCGRRSCETKPWSSSQIVNMLKGCRGEWVLDLPVKMLTSLCLGSTPGSGFLLTQILGGNSDGLSTGIPGGGRAIVMV